jgi:hypothetical protein
VFLGFQIRSLDPRRLCDPQSGRPSLAGTVPRHRMGELEAALRLVLGL